MALNAIGEFTLNQTSNTFDIASGGGGTATINYEGTATDLGTVQGTLRCVFTEPGAAAGTCSWRGASFVDGGEVVGATGEGVWQKVDGQHKWRVYGVNLLSDGRILASEGEIDLATRSYNGTISEWG
ncbi:MAG: hypothetical protein O7G84_15570 [Gammaproteobacteria bacterium]|jgi:hypothetical protein|nr:hypothetical protein [Gammaproteobacteria bacterium]